MHTASHDQRLIGALSLLLWAISACSNTDDCALSATCTTDSKEDASVLTPDSGVADETGNNPTQMDEEGNTGMLSEADASITAGPSNSTMPDAGQPVITIDFGFCGDALLATGEACDDGDGLNTGAYGGCNPDCTKAPFCGDGRVTDGELCDPLLESGDAGSCDATCGLDEFCGDGKRTGDEECDFGSDKNTGEYGGCTETCKTAPHCGDGVKDPEEDCDLGAAQNDGSYGGCNADCSFAPACNASAGETECDNICATLSTDENNCGSCGNKCASGYSCEGGTCKIGCTDGTRCGDDSCVDTRSDINHCGGCEKPCEAPENGSVKCQNSDCVTSCDDGFASCSGQCFNNATDVDHCGGCTPCEQKPNSSVECSAGECRYSCGTRPPLYCHTAETPACGAWTFDSSSGTEGWGMLNTSYTAASNLRISEGALAFDYDGSGTNGAIVDLLVTPCEVPGTAMVLRFRMRVVPKAGSTESNQIYIAAVFGDAASGTNTPVLDPGTWFERSVRPPEGTEQVQTYGISMYVDAGGPLQQWTVYIDDVELVPKL